MSSRDQIPKQINKIGITCIKLIFASLYCFS